MNSLKNTPFLLAAHKRPVPHTPIWLMRQAGRYMPEYRAIRAKYGMLEVMRTPELAAEVTLQPIEAFDIDAAIIFSDILPPLIGMGLDLEFIGGVGPRIHNPINNAADIEQLRVPTAAENMQPTLDAIKIASDELTPRNIPLIGFCGAPFTLASYAIEGGGSKTYAKTKTLMYNDPAAWDMLMRKLVAVQADYLRAQAAHGASALQVFDSWAGLAMGSLDYERYIQPYNTLLFEEIAAVGVPTINFSTGTAVYLDKVAACGGDVVGVDWRIPLDEAWAKIGHDRAVQGNLDPVALLTEWPQLKERVDDVLMRANGRLGHIFNLGHGIFPNVPVDTVRRLVDYVHEQTAKTG